MVKEYGDIKEIINMGTGAQHGFKVGFPVGCIYYKTIETYSELDKLKNDFELQFDNCTMVCPKCFIDAIIPITEDSKLWNLNDRERLELLKDWKTQGFE